MADYILIGALEAELPPQFLVQALDDDGDGLADPGVWDKVLDAVSTEIDGILGQRYPVPFQNPLPAVVVHSARVLALAMLHRRRGIEDKANPFAKTAQQALEKLQAIAAGKEPLTPEIQRQAPGVSIIGEKSKLQSSSGKITA